MKKSNLGQFNTKSAVWLKPQVLEFIQHSRCIHVLDPFAGEGDLLYALKKYGFVSITGYDIDVEINRKYGWYWNDSLESLPLEPASTIVVTNPPYLAKNSAHRNQLDNYKYFINYPEYEDLYQIALYKILAQYKYSVFIIPETYFLTNLFKEYLNNITILEENPFEDTDCPVCVACFEVTTDFNRLSGNVYDIYKNEVRLFTNHELENIIQQYIPKNDYDIKFNIPTGNLGLRAVDGINPTDRIRFCLPEELGYETEDIKESSRSITIIEVPCVVDKEFLDIANKQLESIREATHDVIFAPFKNNNKVGVRRRRLDYGWARRILNIAIERYLTKNKK